jgi:hypothetical protein
MNMIDLHVEFNNFTALLLGEYMNTIFNLDANCAFQDTKTILGNPYNVILAVP